MEERADGPALREEVRDAAEVDRAGARDRRSSFSSRTQAWRRPFLIALVAAVLAVIIVLARHKLAESLQVLGAASPGWLLLALAAEAVSLTAFGLSRRGLLRANRHRISLRSVMAVTYASNALGLSVPVAGGELAVVYSYRQFRRANLDAATTSWGLALTAALTASRMSSSSALAAVLAYRVVSFWLPLVGGWILMGFLAHPRLRKNKP